MNTRIDTRNRAHLGEDRLATWVRRLGAALDNARAARARARTRRQSIRELGALSDRALQDIGLSRAQIPEVVDGLLARQDQVATTRSQPTKLSVGGRCHA